MQGVRRAAPRLGDTPCVVGLGLVGQLVVRLLVAAGVRVVGLDMVPEARCRLAEQAGAVLVRGPGFVGGLAGRAAIAGRPTSGPRCRPRVPGRGRLLQRPRRAAAKLARDRARVVDIGKTKLDLPWNAYYEKELDVRLSRSYGPGRYDDGYELDGVDYPAGYVRWTERRNLECFLDLLARKDLEVETLVSGTFPLDNAVSVYADLSSGALKAVGVLLSYPAPDPDTQPRPAASLARPASAGVARVPNGPGSKRLAIGFVGAGNYASSMLPPHLVELPNAELVHVADNQVPVGGERPAAVRLHHRVDQRVGRARGRVAGRDLRGDPARDPRGPGYPGPGDRQGSVRGETARADRRGAGPDHRGDHQDRQRPADGRLQPALRPDAGQDEGRVRPGQFRLGHPLPGQRRSARRGQLVPQRGRGVALRRRGWSLPGYARLVDGILPEEVYTAGGGPDSTTCRSRCGSPTEPAA